MRHPNSHLFWLLPFSDSGEALECFLQTVIMWRMVKMSIFTSMSSHYLRTWKLKLYQKTTGSKLCVYLVIWIHHHHYHHHPLEFFWKFSSVVLEGQSFFFYLMGLKNRTNEHHWWCSLYESRKMRFQSGQFETICPSLNLWSQGMHQEALMCMSICLSFSYTWHICRLCSKSK